MPYKVKHAPVYCSEYLSKFLNPNKLKRYTDLAVKCLSRFEFDAIAFTGMSGALVAPGIAMAMQKPLIMVRKGKGKNCHSYMTVEGDAAAKSYVIVDDFVATGNTVNRVIRKIKNFAPNAKCIGTLEITELRSNNVNKIKLYLD